MDVSEMRIRFMINQEKSPTLTADCKSQQAMVREFKQCNQRKSSLRMPSSKLLSSEIIFRSEHNKHIFSLRKPEMQ